MVILVECPECGANIQIQKDVEQGEVMTCQDCGAELEVRSVGPVKLELAPEEEEDWGE